MMNDKGFDCIICMGKLNDPVIGSDGNVYCKHCIQQWVNKKSNNDDKKITEWVKCEIFDKLYTLTQIQGDLNLYRIMDEPDRDLNDLNEAMKIMKMVKNEHEHLMSDEDRKGDIPQSDIMKNIFKKEKMTRSLLFFLSDNWIDDNYNWKLLHYILAYGSYSTIQWTLTNTKNDLKSETLFGHNVLYFLFSELNNLNQSDVSSFFKLMLENNILNEIDERTMNHLCGRHSRLDSKDQLYVMKKFVTKDTDVNVIMNCFNDNNNLNSQDQLELIRYVIEKEVKLDFNDNQKQWRPIHSITSDDNNLSSTDQLKAIESLLAYGVNLEVENSHSWRPIHFVCSKNNNMDSGDQSKAITMMIDHMIDLEVMNNESWRPIHFVTSSSCRLESSDQLSIIKKMMNNVDLDTMNNHAWRPIHFIASNSCNLSSNDQLDAIKMFINKGVDLDAENKDSWRPIHFISSNMNNMLKNEQFEAIKYIVGRGINLDHINNNGMAPIHYVSGRDFSTDSIMQYDVIKLFIESGANLDLMDKNFMRPIHYVLGESNMNFFEIKEILKLFVKKKIDTDVYTMNGENPLDCMAKNKKIRRDKNELAAYLADLEDEECD